MNKTRRQCKERYNKVIAELNSHVNMVNELRRGIYDCVSWSTRNRLHAICVEDIEKLNSLKDSKLKRAMTIMKTEMIKYLIMVRTDIPIRSKVTIKDISEILQG